MYLLCYKRRCLLVLLLCLLAGAKAFVSNPTTVVPLRHVVETGRRTARNIPPRPLRVAATLDNVSDDNKKPSRAVGPNVQLKSYTYDGYKLTYLYKAASPAYRNAPPLLLIHPVGIGMSSWFWERFMEDGPAMYAVDLIGCGLAHGADAWDPNQRGMSVPLAWVKACEALMQQKVLSKSLPIVSSPRYAVVTQGGLAPVGVLLTARNLHKVSHLVLTSPPTDLSTAVTESALQRNYNFFTGPLSAPLAFGLLETRRAVQFFSNLFLFDAPCDDTWLDQAAAETCPAARPPVQVFNAGFCQARSYEPELQAIRDANVPVLVLQGQGDTARNADRTAYYTQQLPQSAVKTIPGKNVLPWESNQDTLQTILQFMGLKPSAAAASRNKPRRNNSSSAASDGARRTLLSLVAGGATAAALQKIPPARAAVGSLPEYQDTNVILQGITVRVADKSQQDAMIKFMTDAFDAQVLRKRIRGGVEETWLGFGPEQLRVPDDFVLSVSSLAKYGGHASIHLVYDDRMTTPLYRVGDAAPGNNIAYLQLGVPQYRVSQMVKNGGNILDAYGIVNVVSPSGLPIRSIVGIAPDPIMFVALNCPNIAETKAFYEKLGFVEQEYPYARPNKGAGQFEPPQPAKSVYLAPTGNGMGILLLPMKKKKVEPNPVVSSLNLVYTPAEGASEADVGLFVDPVGVPLKFQSVTDFGAEEKVTR